MKLNNKKIIFSIAFFGLLLIFLAILSFYKDKKDIKESKTINIQKNVIEEDTNKIYSEKEDLSNKQNTNKEDENDNKEINVSVENKIENIVKEETKKKKEIKSEYKKETFDEKGYLNKYPDYGTKYATLKISKIGVTAPVFFGASDKLLQEGVCHDAGSYFCGENGAIIMCGHNYKYNFDKFGNLIKGDIIEIKTDYGTFYYKLYDTNIIEETEGEKLQIQRNEEILMIYTCYPFKNAGRTKYRYILYAQKI